MSEPRRLRTAVTTGLPFGMVMGLFLGLQRGWPAALIGLASGLLFGLAMADFVLRQRRRMEVRGKQYEGEPLLYQGPANHWLGVESRGGWLILTPTRLLFRSHGKNIENAPFALSLADVTAVEAIRTLGLIPNGLLVRRRAGEPAKFVVQGRSDWVAAIQQATARAP